MAERLNKLRDWFKNYYSELSKNQKIVRISVLVIVVFILAFSIFVLTRTNYAVLGSGLPTDESAKITQKLTEVGIQWKTENNASTVLVPEDEIDSARMQLSLAGFSGPQIFTYDDLLGKLSITMDQETKNELMLQAKEGSMERALISLENVENAIVNLYVKKSSTFLNLEDDVSKASVVLTLSGSEKLTKEQVSGIVSLISDSVKGLNPNNITIVDQSGVRLNKRVDEEDDNYDMEAQDGLKVTTERRINKDLENFLSNIYGEGNVKVNTSVKLDFNGRVSEIVKFSPPVEGATQGLVRSSNELRERVNNDNEGGAPGTDSNTTDTPQYPTGDIGQKDYEKSQSILNYELNKTVEKLEKAKGQIVDISVAVIVNKKTLVDETLTEDDRLKLIDLVRSAAGMDESKNVQVLAKEFFEEPLIQLEPRAATFLGLPLWVFAVIGVLVLLAVVGLVIFLKRKTKETEEVVNEILEEQSELEELSMGEEDKSSPRYQIEKFIDTSPEIVAQLLKSWMNEE